MSIRFNHVTQVLTQIKTQVAHITLDKDVDFKMAVYSYKLVKTMSLLAVKILPKFVTDCITDPQQLWSLLNNYCKYHQCDDKFIFYNYDLYYYLNQLKKIRNQVNHGKKLKIVELIASLEALEYTIKCIENYDEHITNLLYNIFNDIISLLVTNNSFIIIQLPGYNKRTYSVGRKCTINLLQNEKLLKCAHKRNNFSGSVLYVAGVVLVVYELDKDKTICLNLKGKMLSIKNDITVQLLIPL